MRLSIWKETSGLTFVIGPYMSRLIWGSGYGFGYYDGQGPIIRFVRKWWSGWHRWDDDLDLEGYDDLSD